MKFNSYISSESEYHTIRIQLEEKYYSYIFYHFLRRKLISNQFNNAEPMEASGELSKWSGGDATVLQKF